MFPLQARLWPRGWVEVYLFTSKTTALEGGKWSAALPGCTLPPGRTRYPLYRRLGGPQGQSGRAENHAPPHSISGPSNPVARSLYRLSYPAHPWVMWALESSWRCFKSLRVTNASLHQPVPSLKQTERPANSTVAMQNNCVNVGQRSAGLPVGHWQRTRFRTRLVAGSS